MQPARAAVVRRSDTIRSRLPRPTMRPRRMPHHGRRETRRQRTSVRLPGW